MGIPQKPKEGNMATKIVRLRDGYHVLGKVFKTLTGAYSYRAEMEDDEMDFSPYSDNDKPISKYELQRKPKDKDAEIARLNEVLEYIKEKDTKLQHMLSENGKTITMLKAKAARAIRDVIKLKADLVFAQKACQTLVEENTQLKARLGLEQTILVHRRTL